MKKSDLFLLVFILLFVASCKPPQSCNPGDRGSQCGMVQSFLQGISTGTPTGTAPTVPSAPTGVSVVPGNAQVTISYTAVAGATSYNIYWGTQAGVTKATGTSIANGSATSYVHNIANNTTYYYIVTAVNSVGESVASTEAAATPSCNPCRMFVTSTSYNGALSTNGGVAGAPTGATGIAGADAKCNWDTNKPGAPASAVYKAMIADGTNRIACTSGDCLTNGASEHIDWVFHSNRKYVRADGITLIQTTNGNGLLPFPLIYAVTAVTALQNWTGINDPTSRWTSSSSHCVNWTSNFSTDSGNHGYPDYSIVYSGGSLLAGPSAYFCNTPNYLVCVEQ